MAYRKEPLVEGEYYHLYNRGNSKQDIFLDEEDRARFIKLLFLCNSEKRINFRDDIVDRGIDAFDFERGENIVSLGAWVLMSNHFHLYITSKKFPEDRPRGSAGNEISAITEFMRKLLTGYSSYFNKKYNRTGTLFEGRFKSTRVTNDQQAKYLFSYIHLNPVKIIDKEWKENGIQDMSRAIKFLDTYVWSSYHDHKGIVRRENNLLSVKEFPEYFSSPAIFEKEIFEWLIPLGPS
ncbi:MAG: hypothetical protein Q8P17_04035 [bacterium]|nr:hypothetical protein [bacterium]